MTISIPALIGCYRQINDPEGNLYRALAPMNGTQKLVFGICPADKTPTDMHMITINVGYAFKL
jgi:hypothetical protein